MPTELDETLGVLRVDEIHSFVVLSEELHFTRAAQRLAVTPGGLSRRIARLERALGALLLLRTTRSVALTPYGRKFAPAARRLMADVNSLPEGTQHGLTQTWVSSGRFPKELPGEQGPDRPVGDLPVA